MKKIYYTTIIPLTLALASLASCNGKLQQAFHESPSERVQASISSLHEELTSSPSGWSVLYFPHCDSLLFSNPNELIGQTAFRGRLGYGGSSFVMKFSKEGTVEMTADFTEASCDEPKVSRYTIKRGSYTQLTFETFNYIHELVNDSFRGSTDFLYQGKNEYGQLVFRTAGTILPAKEYIIFTKLKSDEDPLVKTYQNRLFFEEMQNPQLSIRMGDRVYFESDNYIKTKAETNRPYIKELTTKRYYLFLYNKKRNPIPGYPALQMVGLGSGYAGTSEGITFRAGLRYSKDIVFMDFERIDDRFEAELVKVYNPHTRVTSLESKHLHPEGIPTGVKAVIWDAPIIKD